MNDEQRSHFYDGLAEAMQVPRAGLNASTALGEEWDSLAWYSTIALLEDVFGVEADARALSKCKTVGEILTLAGTLP